MTFIKKTEDFTCDHCYRNTKGDGYTNHCPVCLWSKHVDQNPGDRSSVCRGLMKPINLLTKHGKEQIVHKCMRCHQQKNNRLSEDDDYDEIVRIMSIEPNER